MLASRQSGVEGFLEEPFPSLSFYPSLRHAQTTTAKCYTETAMFLGVNFTVLEEEGPHIRPSPTPPLPPAARPPAPVC